MGKKLIIDEESLIKIANAIREKEETTNPIQLTEMADRIKSLIVSEEVYEGDYVVIPKIYPQMLSTTNKKMEDDVTIDSIPFSKVTNESGGETFNIGDTIMTNRGLSLSFEE